VWNYRGAHNLLIPWVEVDRTKVPGGGAELRLMQRGTEFSIMAGTAELMNSRLSGSEESLATLTLARIASRPAPMVLIGGLGMGFTLRAALSASSDARFVVGELVPAVVEWAKGPLSGVFAGSIDDARVSIVVNDIGRIIGSARAAYDAILLDVDNGPDGLSRESNDSLYSAKGLREAWVALRPGGVLAVWSSGPNPDFTKRLVRAGFAAEEAKVRANGKRGGARHVIWLATKK
jgi:spermidine synthase